jgi:hypothetical protein
MGVLRKKGESTETVTVRVPRVKAGLDRLREETSAPASTECNAIGCGGSGYETDSRRVAASQWRGQWRGRDNGLATSAGGGV